MNYLNSSLIIFIILLCIVLLMILTRSTLMIWTGFILMPVLVIAQTYVVLKKGENKESKNEFGDKWYDNK